jgi:hypothetical protein
MALWSSMERLYRFDVNKKTTPDSVYISMRSYLYYEPLLNLAYIANEIPEDIEGPILQM